VTKTDKPAEGACHAVCQCCLPLSSTTISFVAELLRAT
jgi:hypothetical protein